MANFINFNGKLVPAGSPIITADSRALRYGDGLFETMRVQNGRVLLFDWHMERLFEGMRSLQFELPRLLTADYLKESVLELCKKNGVSVLARVRLNVIRSTGGLYDPLNLVPQYIIEAMPLAGHYQSLNENGLVLGLYEGGYKSCDRLANIKSNNYLLYVLAALEAKKNRWNDSLVLNQFGRISDSTIANLFWVKNGTVYTPPLSEGPVAGILRRWLLEKCRSTSAMAVEALADASILESADEIFLTNAISGIRWVQQCNDRTYHQHLAPRIYSEWLEWNA